MMELSPNPFRKYFVAEPWEEIVDVPTIYEQESQKIAAIFDDVDQSGVSQVVLPLSEPGNGKTHFLSRIRSSIQSRGIFACFLPHGTPNSFARQALRQTVDSLLKPSAVDGLTQLEVLTAHTLRHFHTVQNPHDETDEPQEIIAKVKNRQIDVNSYLYTAGAWFQQRHLVFHEEVLEVLFARISADAKYIWQTNKWLKGQELPAVIADELAISSSLAETPMEALATLGAIASLYFPIVFAIDQVDIVGEDSATINKLGEFIADLRHKAPNFVILLSCLATIWDEKFKKVASSIVDRLEENKLQLLIFEDKQKLAIIEKRLELIEKPAGAKDLWPFAQETINGLLRCNRPRLLIQKCSQEYEKLRSGGRPSEQQQFPEESTTTEPPLPSASREEILDKAFRHAYENLQSGPKITFEDDDFILYCAKILSIYRRCGESINGHSITNVEIAQIRKNFSLIQATCNYHSEPLVAVLAFISAESNRSVAATLRHVVGYQQEHPEHRIFVLRDRLVGEISPNAKKALEFLDECIDRHGKLVWIEREDYWHLRSFWSVLSQVASGELSDDDGASLSQEDFAQYIVTRHPLASLRSFAAIFPETAVGNAEQHNGESSPVEEAQVPGLELTEMSGGDCAETPAQNRDTDSPEEQSDHIRHAVFDEVSESSRKILEIMHNRHLVSIDELCSQFAGLDRDTIWCIVDENPYLRKLPQNENFIQYRAKVPRYF